EVMTKIDKHQPVVVIFAEVSKAQGIARQGDPLEAVGLLPAEHRILAAQAQQVPVKGVTGSVAGTLREVQLAALERMAVARVGQRSPRLVGRQTGELIEEFHPAGFDRGGRRRSRISEIEKRS